LWIPTLRQCSDRPASLAEADDPVTFFEVDWRFGRRRDPPRLQCRDGLCFAAFQESVDDRLFRWRGRRLFVFDNLFGVPPLGLLYR
jgi:hypothetical protein